MDARYFDRQGNPLPDVFAWAALIEGKFDARRVAATEIGEMLVSTVWLGLNHQWGDGPPLIFETMIFGGEHDGWQDRYSTEEEAMAGHERACRIARGEEPAR